MELILPVDLLIEIISYFPFETLQVVCRNPRFLSLVDRPLLWINRIKNEFSTATIPQNSDEYKNFYLKCRDLYLEFIDSHISEFPQYQFFQNDSCIFYFKEIKLPFEILNCQINNIFANISTIYNIIQPDIWIGKNTIRYGDMPKNIFSKYATSNVQYFLVERLKYSRMTISEYIVQDKTKLISEKEAIDFTLRCIKKGYWFGKCNNVEINLQELAAHGIITIIKRIIDYYP
jgi:hypothetical protein